MKRLFLFFIICFIVLGSKSTLSTGEEIKDLKSDDPIAHETYYTLITGNIHMWANSSGTWIKDNNGLYSEPHTWYDTPSDTRIKLPDGAIVQDIYPYNRSIFLFEEDIDHHYWNRGIYASNKIGYDQWYNSYASSNIKIKSFDTEVVEVGKNAGTYAVFDWSALLTPNMRISNPTNEIEKSAEEYYFYNVKESIKLNNRSEYFNFFGGEDYCKENLPYLVDQYDAMVDQVFSSKVQGLLIFIPIVIEYQLPVDTPVVHISHFEEDGTALPSYDYDQPYTNGIYTFDATPISGYEVYGSRMAYGAVPTSAVVEGLETQSVTVDGTVTDIYVEFYYTEFDPPPSDGDAAYDEMDPESEGWIFRNDP